MSRYTTSWKLGTAVTFRRASAKLLAHKPYFAGWGGNAQNPSEGFSRIIIPDEGKILVQADCAGADALIVAYLVRNANYRSLFLNKIKPHFYMALHIFEEQWISEGFPATKELVTLKPIDLARHPDWKPLQQYIKDTDPKNNRYFVGKKSGHSYNYGMFPKTNQEAILKETEGRVFLPIEVCQRGREKHMELFPEIHFEYHTWIQKQLRETRTLYNLFGYPRYFSGPFTDKMWREGYAHPPQSTVAIITMTAFTKMQNFIEDNKLKDWDVLNDKHDSVMCQVPVGAERECAKILQEYLAVEMTSPIDGEKFKMGSEVKVGFNWADKSDDNPQGMKELSL